MTRDDRPKTLAALKRKLKALGDMDDETTKKIVCALIGHSRIQEHCWGYWSCARCGEHLGDSLASIYPNADKVVVVGHNCDKCRENYKACDWRDTFMAPEPFAKESR